MKSGVHATLAGVLIAFCIPIRDKEGHCPLRELEHNLHGSGAYYSGDRQGILVGSLLSALAAYVLLHFSLPKAAGDSQQE